MRKQLDLFPSTVVPQTFDECFRNDPTTFAQVELEEARTDLSIEMDSILQCDIETAIESGDDNRLVELLQMKTAYQQ